MIIDNYRFPSNIVVMEFQFEEESIDFRDWWREEGEKLFENYLRSVLDNKETTIKSHICSCGKAGDYINLLCECGEEHVCGFCGKPIL